LKPYWVLVPVSQWGVKLLMDSSVSLSRYLELRIWCQ
jgi:hypothetical protein